MSHYIYCYMKYVLYFYMHKSMWGFYFDTCNDRGNRKQEVGSERLEESCEKCIPKKTMAVSLKCSSHVRSLMLMSF